jgi:hypothetical protein
MGCGISSSTPVVGGASLSAQHQRSSGTIQPPPLLEGAHGIPLIRGDSGRCRGAPTTSSATPTTRPGIPANHHNHKLVARPPPMTTIPPGQQSPHTDLVGEISLGGVGGGGSHRVIGTSDLGDGRRSNGGSSSAGQAVNPPPVMGRRQVRPPPTAGNTLQLSAAGSAMNVIRRGSMGSGGRR